MERTYEVGILKSLGATDGDVRNLFLIEASAMGLLRQWPEDSDIDMQQAQMGKPIICTSRKHQNIIHLVMPVPKKKMEVVGQAA